MKPKRNVYQFSNFILSFFGANGLGFFSNPFSCYPLYFYTCQVFKTWQV